jgi:TPR repeat protein
MPHALARLWLFEILLCLLAFLPSLASAGVTPEEVEAFESYKAQATKGDKVAQFFVGLCYSTGSGVKENQRESVSWYRKAAEQGFAPAQFSLGYH